MRTWSQGAILLQDFINQHVRIIDFLNLTCPSKNPDMKKKINRLKEHFSFPCLSRVNRLTVFYREYTVNPGIRPCHPHSL
jgi:hypothetical protein